MIGIIYGTLVVLFAAGFIVTNMLLLGTLNGYIITAALVTLAGISAGAVIFLEKDIESIKTYINIKKDNKKANGLKAEGTFDKLKLELDKEMEERKNLSEFITEKLKLGFDLQQTITKLADSGYKQEIINVVCQKLVNDGVIVIEQPKPEVSEEKQKIDKELEEKFDIPPEPPKQKVKEDGTITCPFFDKENGQKCKEKFSGEEAMPSWKKHIAMKHGMKLKSK